MKRITEDLDYRQFIAHQQKPFIVSFSEFEKDIISLSEYGPENFGENLPWHKMSDKFRLRPGEVTVWAGINGHGKSLIIGQVALWLIMESRVIIASMEMPIAPLAFRMIRQASGVQRPAEQFIKKWLRYTDNRLWVYDQHDSLDPESVLGMAWYAVTKRGCKHVFIDSLIKCGIRPDDYGKQKDLVDRFCWLAKETKCHVHIVHHMRKGEKESQRPDKFDVRGASEIIDLVDNLCMVHRNKWKEQQVEAGKEVKEGMPDTQLIVAKQRHGSGWEGTLPLYFHGQSQQLMHYPGARAMVWPVLMEPANVATL